MDSKNTQTGLQKTVHLILMCVFVFLFPFSVGALSLVVPSDAQDSLTENEPSNHDVSFVTPTGIWDDDSTATIEYPVGFIMGSVGESDIDVEGSVTGEMTTAVDCTGVEEVGVSVVGQIITLQFCNGDGGVIAPAESVLIEIGTSATAFATGVNQITNPVAGQYTSFIAGTMTDAGFIAIPIMPSDNVSVSASIPADPVGGGSNIFFGAEVVAEGVAVPNGTVVLLHNGQVVHTTNSDENGYFFIVSDIGEDIGLGSLVFASYDSEGNTAGLYSYPGKIDLSFTKFINGLILAPSLVVGDVSSREKEIYNFRGFAPPKSTVFVTITGGGNEFTYKVETNKKGLYFLSLDEDDIPVGEYIVSAVYLMSDGSKLSGESFVSLGVQFDFGENIFNSFENIFSGIFDLSEDETFFEKIFDIVDLGPGVVAEEYLQSLFSLSDIAAKLGLNLDVLAEKMVISDTRFHVYEYYAPYVFGGVSVAALFITMVLFSPRRFKKTLLAKNKE